MNEMKQAYPVAVFAYKRIAPLEMCLRSLAKCDGASQTKVNIYVDGPKGSDERAAVESVWAFLDEYMPTAGFAAYEIHKRNENAGIHTNVIEGINDTLKDADACIAVEDDLILAADFLTYMNGALDYYKDDDRYATVSAYTYPLKELKKYRHDVYTLGIGFSWGWATWKDRWEAVDWDLSDYEDFKRDIKAQKEFAKHRHELCGWFMEQVDSGDPQWDWDYRWDYHLFRHGLWAVYPRESRVRNEGFGGDGTHCFGDDREYNSELRNSTGDCIFEKLPVNKRLQKAFAMHGVRTLSVKIKDNIAKRIHVGKYRRQTIN